VRIAPEERIGLVGCVKQRADDSQPASALYTFALFRGRVRYVERSCSRWFVLSALHGLVEPTTVLRPYDESLNRASRDCRRQWSQPVLDQLGDTLRDLSGYSFQIHAGAPYREYGLVDGLSATGSTVDVPTAGLGIGRQLAFYSKIAG
jgi:hypothetical protein